MASHKQGLTKQEEIIRVTGIRSAQMSVVVAGGILAVSGWAGLAWLLGNTLPTVPNRWAMFVLLQIALSGTALPFINFLHRRFARDAGISITPVVLVRQAIWFGTFATVCAWLRIPRLLSVPTALIIAVALLIIESLLRL